MFANIIVCHGCMPVERFVSSNEKHHTRTDNQAARYPTSTVKVTHSDGPAPDGLTPDAGFLAELETLVDVLERLLDVAFGFESPQETPGVGVVRLQAIQVTLVVRPFLNIFYTHCPVNPRQFNNGSSESWFPILCSVHAPCFAAIMYLSVLTTDAM